MDNCTKRLYLFLFGCIGTRVGLALAAKHLGNTNKEYLKIMGILFIIPAAVMLMLFLTDSRKTGPEVFGDKIWWNFARPMHAIMLFAFAYLAIAGSECAWQFLLVDAFLGLYLFTNNRIVNKSCTKTNSNAS
jgi:hypothetical protein